MAKTTKITLRIADDKVPAVIAALDAYYHDRPDGSTDAQWAKICVKKHIIQLVRQHKNQMAMTQTVADIQSEVDEVDAAIT